MLKAEMPGLEAAEREHLLIVAKFAERRHAAIAAMDTASRYEAFAGWKAIR